MTIKSLPEGEELDSFFGPKEPRTEPNWDALKLPEDDDGTARYGPRSLKEETLVVLRDCLWILGSVHKDAGAHAAYNRALWNRISRLIHKLEVS